MTRHEMGCGACPAATAFPWQCPTQLTPARNRSFDGLPRPTRLQTVLGGLGGPTATERQRGCGRAATADPVRAAEPAEGEGRIWACVAPGAATAPRGPALLDTCA